MRLIFGGFLLAVWALFPTWRAVAQDQSKTTAQWLKDFQANWDDSTWEKSFRTVPGKFMRPLNDQCWKFRLIAMQGVVANGKVGIPTLLEALKSTNADVRIFAAQSLRYLAPDVPVEPLLAAAKNDPDATVRLYAVDALGMKGDPKIDFDALLSVEKQRDVRMHLNYAKERKGTAVDAKMVQQLIQWDPKSIATAEVGKKAPDFGLRSVTGKEIKLSDYRGKSAVVLVFIYGDT
ncbi:MAG: HEAT repeat domain-containing protein [Zavarzinella sp.]